MIYNNFDNFNTMSIKQTSSIMNKHEDLSDCSSQSVLTAADKFLKSVNSMNETVMVPCKLLDMEVSQNKKRVPKMLTGSEDPYALYALLNSIKNSVMYGPSSEDDEFEEEKVTVRSSSSDQWSGGAGTTKPIAQSTSNNVKGHFRRQSTLSMISVNSTSSEGDSEPCSEAGDSGLEVEPEEPEDSVKTIVSDLKGHLLGLHCCLSSLTETANFITDRYKEEMNK